jgi:malonyl-CoA decarboxylase
MRATELGEGYLARDAEGRRLFLQVLGESFAVDETALEAAIARYEGAESVAARETAVTALRQAVVPPRTKLLIQFNTLPQGIEFLVKMREDLLSFLGQVPSLRGLDDDLRELLVSWFDPGFLDLEPVTWTSSAELLEKLIAYEAVHEISSWEDLRKRVHFPDRRLYALFHPRMPKEPLAFVEVALVKGLAGNVQRLLDAEAPAEDPAEAEAAIFYSISNTQRGLQGISFGEFLIKGVVQRLGGELPRLKIFSTLSPIPGFRDWLARLPAEAFKALLSEADLEALAGLGEDGDAAARLAAALGRLEWPAEAATAAALETPLMALCVQYLQRKQADGRPLDPVARFHLRNGARLERLNWRADTSPRGLRRSAGMMVNYRYLPGEMEENHEAYVKDGRIALGPDFKALVKRLGQSGDGRRTRRTRG